MAWRREYQAGAVVALCRLPEYGFDLVRLAGFEPATRCLEGAAQVSGEVPGLRQSTCMVRRRVLLPRFVGVGCGCQQHESQLPPVRGTRPFCPSTRPG